MLESVIALYIMCTQASEKLYTYIYNIQTIIVYKSLLIITIWHCTICMINSLALYVSQGVGITYIIQPNAFVCMLLHLRIEPIALSPAIPKNIDLFFLFPINIPILFL